ncbi:hypothetical protein RRG08_015430 [Elysia crispata]|uniref:Uncharacterized protein n=1 Tax=Elysia crispata TaxID=231223 RepID=A0AAE0YHG2_9GAST|nr:hypothetical protein RRG08_015430 [Elysia crispata]
MRNDVEVSATIIVDREDKAKQTHSVSHLYKTKRTKRSRHIQSPTCIRQRGQSEAYISGLISCQMERAIERTADPPAQILSPSFSSCLESYLGVLEGTTSISYLTENPGLDGAWIMHVTGTQGGDNHEQLCKLSDRTSSQIDRVC